MKENQQALKEEFQKLDKTDIETYQKMKDIFKLYSEETAGLCEQLNVLMSFDLT